MSFFIVTGPKAFVRAGIECSSAVLVSVVQAYCVQVYQNTTEQKASKRLAAITVWPEITAG